MKTFTARVVNGLLIVEDPCELPEGTSAHLVADEDDDLDPEERAERDAAIDQAWARVQAGERGVPADELIRRLQQKR